MILTKKAKDCEHEFVQVVKQITVDNIGIRVPGIRGETNFMYSGAFFRIIVCKFCKSYEFKRLEYVK